MRNGNPWKYPSKQQIIEACENRIRAEILSWMLSVHRKKREAHPNAPDDAPDLLIQVTAIRLAGIVGCTDRTIRTHVAWLKRRGFITIHKPASFNHTSRYQVNLGKIKPEDLPLLELDPLGKNFLIDQENASPSIRKDFPNRLGRNFLIYKASLPSSRSIITTQTDGDGQDEDEEKRQIIDRLRGLGVAKEHAEQWLTTYTRQLIVTGIDYVRLRCSKETIDNPPGLLNRFLQNPTAKGYELNKQGCWVSSRVMQQKHEKSIYRDYTAERMKEETLDRITTNK